MPTGGDCASRVVGQLNGQVPTHFQGAIVTTHRGQTHVAAHDDRGTQDTAIAFDSAKIVGHGDRAEEVIRLAVTDRERSCGRPCASLCRTCSRAVDDNFANGIGCDIVEIDVARGWHIAGFNTCGRGRRCVDAIHKLGSSQTQGNRAGDVGVD